MSCSVIECKYLEVSVKKWKIIYFYLRQSKMKTSIAFIGDFPGKVDDKGRIVLPVNFKKKMDQAGKDAFIVRKSHFANCLKLYLEEEFLNEHELLESNADPFNGEHERVLREKNKNVFEVSLAENGRMTIPSRFLKMVGIDKDVVIAGQVKTLEIWDKEQYDAVKDKDIDFSIITRNRKDTNSGNHE